MSSFEDPIVQSLTNANVASGAAIDQSKLNLTKGRFALPLGPSSSVTSQAATANRVYLTEFELLTAQTVNGVIYNVGTTSNGNIRAHIFGPVVTDEVAAGLTLPVESASIVQAAINTVQTLLLADTVLQPGRYFAGIQFSSATGTFMRTSNITGGLLPGTQKYFDNGSFAVATTPCPATTASDSAHPWMALSFKTT